MSILRRSTWAGNIPHSWDLPALGLDPNVRSFRVANRCPGRAPLGSRGLRTKNAPPAGGPRKPFGIFCGPVLGLRSMGTEGGSVPYVAGGLVLSLHSDIT